MQILRGKKNHFLKAVTRPPEGVYFSLRFLKVVCDHLFVANFLLEVVCGYLFEVVVSHHFVQRNTEVVSGSISYLKSPGGLVPVTELEVASVLPLAAALARTLTRNGNRLNLSSQQVLDDRVFRIVRAFLAQIVSVLAVIETESPRVVNCARSIHHSECERKC
jgi:hypothetical protein